MNFDRITHLFQIPLTWFKKVNRLLFTHPGTGINYDPDAEDGPRISVDTSRLGSFFAAKDHDHDNDYYQKASGSGVMYSTNGTLSLKQIGTTGNDVARGDHSHGEFGHFHSDGKFTWTSTATPIKVLVTDDSGNLFVAAISAVVPAPDLSGFITRAELDPRTVITINNLAIYGVLTTSDLDPSTVLTTNNLDINGGTILTTANGFSGNVTQVTDVNWNGVSLTKTTKTLTFTNGLLTSVGNDSQTTIDTPTKITWN